MFKQFKNNRAQAHVGEYAILLALVVGAAATMSVYFQRTIQARIRSGALYVGQMIREQAVIADASNVSQPLYASRGSFWTQYEPYYQNTTSNIARSSRIQETLQPTHFYYPRGYFRSLPSGIYGKDETTTSEVSTFQDTAAPRFGEGH